MNITRYFNGAMFGMTAEYCYRVHCGGIQIFILVTLLVGGIIDLCYYELKKKNFKSE